MNRCTWCKTVIESPVTCAQDSTVVFCSTACGEKWMKSEIKAIKTEAKHFDTGKAPLEQIPWESLKMIADCFAYGEGKYSKFNWCHGMAWLKLAGSCCRHLYKWIGGEDNDDESGLSHMAHLATDAIMLCWYISKQKGTDDRYKG